MTAVPRLLRGHQSDGGHLGDLVHDYVDDLLAPDVALRVDQHLLVCEMCRCAVEQERRLIDQLRGHRPDPVRHQSLVEGLLGMAEQAPPPRPLPGPSVVTSGAPPQYQSARNSFTAALVAVVGCAGVALVVSTTPSRTSQPPRPANPANVQVRSASSAGGVSAYAVLRAEQDAEGSSDAPGARRGNTAFGDRLP